MVVVNKIDLASPRSRWWRSWRRRAEPGRLGLLPGLGPHRRGRERRWSSTSSARLPEGPRYFPDDVVTDVPEAFWVAELVREQLLAVTHDELPYSIATRVTEWEWPRIRVEILVERESQKGMVIGKGGAVLKEVGTAARAQLPEGRLPRAVRHGRQGLAAPPRPHRPPRVLGREARAPPLAPSDRGAGAAPRLLGGAAACGPSVAATSTPPSLRVKPS